VLCFDIIDLGPLNKNYGREAGDKAILECLRRIDTHSDENCILFRIGGDEFALVSDLEDFQEVEGLAKNIIGLNDHPIVHNNSEIPVSMRVGSTKIAGSNVRYKDLFSYLNQAIFRELYYRIST